MLLNSDCVRDSLIWIENNQNIDSRYGLPVRIPIKELLESNLREDYEKEEIEYTIQQMMKSNLIESEFTRYLGGYDLIINDISPSGHEFLANIRSNNIWQKTKTVSKKIGVTSLSGLKDISAQIISELIKQTFLPEQ